MSNDLRKATTKSLLDLGRMMKSFSLVWQHMTWTTQVHHLSRRPQDVLYIVSIRNNSVAASNQLCKQDLRFVR